MSPISRWIGAALVVGGGLAAFAYFSPEEEQGIRPSGDLVRVERGSLTISVASSGTVRNENASIIKNKVEGNTSILWIIEEGTQVPAGELLMELDSSALRDEQLEEEIEVETSKASLVNAQQMLEIARKQGEADIEASMVAYRLALLDVQKYAGIDVSKLAELEDGLDLAEAAAGSLLAEINDLASRVSADEANRAKLHGLIERLDGGYKQELRKALNSVVLADAERLRAKSQVEGSEELYSRNFISATELEGDRLNLQRSELDLEVAIGELELLARFTYKRTIEELASAVNQARFALDRAKHEAEANLVDAQANVHARRERLVRDEQHLREINEQLAACEIRAPQAGMVVYGTTGRDDDDRNEPLAEGVDVRERQDLFRLPTSDRLAADIKIHESMLEVVEVGMPVVVSTAALPGRLFDGEIVKIAVLPDAQSRWLNPNLKVYNTIVHIVGDSAGLRTGMSCTAEILVEEFQDTLYLPIQCVVRIDGQATVYVPGEQGELVARRIEAGLDDNRYVQVLSGLEEGDLVSLSPPLEQSEREGRSSREEEGEDGEQGRDDDGEGARSRDDDGPGGRAATASVDADS